LYKTADGSGQQDCSEQYNIELC